MTAPYPEGLETSMDMLKRICGGDTEACSEIEKVTERPAGRPPKNHDNVQDFPTGNSEQAALRRLRRQRPDLLKRVIAGELSAHGAMIVAGFRKRSLTIPSEPGKAARALRNHFRGPDLAALIEELQRVPLWAVQLPPRPRARPHRQAHLFPRRKRWYSVPMVATGAATRRGRIKFPMET
jgi:hypothetical protein